MSNQISKTMLFLLLFCATPARADPQLQGGVEEDTQGNYRIQNPQAGVLNAAPPAAPSFRAQASVSPLNGGVVNNDSFSAQGQAQAQAQAQTPLSGAARGNQPILGGAAGGQDEWWVNWDEWRRRVTDTVWGPLRGAMLYGQTRVDYVLTRDHRIHITNVYSPDPTGMSGTIVANRIMQLDGDPVFTFPSGSQTTNTSQFQHGFRTSISRKIARTTLSSRWNGACNEAMVGQTIQTQCCIAGGGPAGMMLGFLLARSGIDVVVLEKHADFFRDFRGDTVHPSTLEIMYELGLLDEFLKVPHQQITKIGAQIGKDDVMIADFSHLPTHCKFVAMMPQWDFLDFLASHAKQYPGFHLHMNSEVTDLIIDQDNVLGVKAKSPQGDLNVHAKLTVGADGRSSIVRSVAKLDVIDFGAPIDVLWMRISKQPSDPEQALGRINTGKMLVMFDRGEYWQSAFVIQKGGAEAIKQKGMPAFRSEITSLAPFLTGRITELKDWDQVKLLSVQVNRLRKWYSPGLLCIGDAAHAMSPIGGVGINLAIQDAVAAANVIWEPLRSNNTPSIKQLKQVQKRREFPTRMTQGLQLIIQNGLIKNVIKGTKPVRAPWFIQLGQKLPALGIIPAFLGGVGFRPEHVRTKTS